MIRLTVLYNLAPDADADAYVAWRLTAHAAYVQAMPGVIASCFGPVVEQWGDGPGCDYQFQTTVDWPDHQSFREAFFNDKAQSDLRKNLQKLGDYRFIVSEIVTA